MIDMKLSLITHGFQQLKHLHRPAHNIWLYSPDRMFDVQAFRCRRPFESDHGKGNYPKAAEQLLAACPRKLPLRTRRALELSTSCTARRTIAPEAEKWPQLGPDWPNIGQIGTKFANISVGQLRQLAEHWPKLRPNSTNIGPVLPTFGQCRPNSDKLLTNIYQMCPMLPRLAQVAGPHLAEFGPTSAPGATARQL